MDIIFEENYNISYGSVFFAIIIFGSVYCGRILRLFLRLTIR